MCSLIYLLSCSYFNPGIRSRSTGPSHSRSNQRRHDAENITRRWVTGKERFPQQVTIVPNSAWGSNDTGGVSKSSYSVPKSGWGENSKKTSNNSFTWTPPGPNLCTERAWRENQTLTVVNSGKKWASQGPKLMDQIRWGDNSTVAVSTNRPWNECHVPLTPIRMIYCMRITGSICALLID